MKKHQEEETEALKLEGCMKTKNSNRFLGTAEIINEVCVLYIPGSS